MPHLHSHNLQSDLNSLTVVRHAYVFSHTIRLEYAFSSAFKVGRKRFKKRYALCMHQHVCTVVFAGKVFTGKLPSCGEDRLKLFQTT